MICLAIFFSLFPSSVITDTPPILSTESVVKDAQEQKSIADSSLRTSVKGSRVYLIGDLLYWSANEEGLNPSYKAKGEPGQLPLTDLKIKAFKEQWSPGFRIGLGYLIPHDKWEARGYVTQLRTSNHFEDSTDEDEFIQPNFGELIDTPQGFNREHGHWHLKYRLFDLDLGRAFVASKALAIGVFFGGRFGWIHQNLRIKFSEAQGGDSSVFLNIESKNHYNAGGLRLGTDLNFYLAKYVWFFGEAAASLLFGPLENETEVKRENAEQSSTLFSGKNTPNCCLANMELRGGIKGCIPLYRKWAFLTLGLTYDMSLWFSHNQLLSFFSTPSALQVQFQESNLILQGITVTTRLDF